MIGNCVAVLMLRSIIIEVSFEIVLGLCYKDQAQETSKIVVHFVDKHCGSG